MTKKLLSELIGTFFLVATVIGSGHMAENLFNDSPGNQLIANTLATGVMLFVLINIFSTYSGAHFNPVVSFCFMLRGDLTIKQFINFATAQNFGGILGAIIANYMFTDYLFVFSQVERYSDKLFISEIIATFGLVATIFGLIEANKSNTIALLILILNLFEWLIILNIDSFVKSFKGLVCLSFGSNIFLPLYKPEIILIP